MPDALNQVHRARLWFAPAVTCTRTAQASGSEWATLGCRHLGFKPQCHAKLGAVEQAFVVPDRIFDEPQLADIYDQLESDRSDLDVYLVIARELGARSAVDIGCGTGSFACLLTSEALEVVGVEPLAAAFRVP